MGNSAEPIVPIFIPKVYVYDSIKLKKSGYNIRLVMPVILSTRCNLVMDNFPFDNQTCPFFFRAWSASRDFTELGITKEAPQLWRTPGWENQLAMSDKSQEFEVTAVSSQEGDLQHPDHDNLESHQGEY